MTGEESGFTILPLDRLKDETDNLTYRSSRKSCKSGHDDHDWIADVEYVTNLHDILNVSFRTVDYEELENSLSCYANLPNLVEISIEYGGRKLPPGLELFGDLKNLYFFTSPLLFDDGTTMQSIPFDRLKNLEKLVFSSGNLNVEDLNPQILDLDRLKELSLRSLAGTKLPSWFGGLKNLETLYIRRIPLKSLAEISTLSNLKTLTLFEIDLNSVPLPLSNLLNLETLNLMKNSLTSIPLSVYALPKLKTLRIGYNKLTDVPNQIIAKIDHVEGLDTNELDKAKIDQFKVLQKLAHS